VELTPFLHVLIQAPFLQAMIQAPLRNRFRRIDSTSPGALIGAIFARAEASTFVQGWRSSQA
jgi:hypothetical protein